MLRNEFEYYENTWFQIKTYRETGKFWLREESGVGFGRRYSRQCVDGQRILGDFCCYGKGNVKHITTNSAT